MGEILQGKQALVFASPFYKVENVPGSTLMLLTNVIMFRLNIHLTNLSWVSTGLLCSGATLDFWVHIRIKCSYLEEFHKAFKETELATTIYLQDRTQENKW